jgi:hypothetical protein
MRSASLSRLSGASGLATHKLPDIKPSDIFQLRLQTQQMALRALHLRTHRHRIQQLILANTNAINKTMEQQSDEPAVVTNHTNTIPQLRRSIDGAENTLQSLREQVETVRQHDKTFFVRELEEEVKLTYCEYQRICRNLQDSKIGENQVSQKLHEAEQRCSTQRLSELRNEVRTLREGNASLRDKAVAYYVKREKLVAEHRIKDDQEKKVPGQKAVQAVNAEKAETKTQFGDLVQQLQDKRTQHLDSITELREITENQKQKIAAFLRETEVPEEIKPISDNL